MFGLPLRLAPGGKAGGPYRRAQPHTLKSLAIGGVEAFWLALIAALFAVWAMSANRSDDRASSSTGCLFAGKGGVVCNRSAANAEARTEGENADASCVSLGRGGRYCPQ